MAVFGAWACVPALLFIASTAARAQNPTPAAPGFYDVRAYGAHGDGTTLDSPAIDSAIQAAAAAGGGTVLFTAGTYLAVTIHLQSHVTLDLEPGAVLLAATPGPGVAYDTPEPNAYAQFQDFGHSRFRNSLIFGEGLQDIGIVGSGEINGAALARDDGYGNHYGNKSIALENCRNVTLRDLTIVHGGWFAILATGVDNLTIDNLRIDTNRDGMDVDCCQNVHISDCFVNSPRDDGICLKSSYALGSARATENVTIDNCQVSGWDEGTMLDGTYQGKPGSGTGRIKFGTESNGGFKNITISNCVFVHCCGLALETVDGGTLEDVTISNISMRDINNAPIFLRLGRRMRAPKGTAVGALRNITISNVDVDGASAQAGILIAGIPGYPIQDVTLSNIRLTMPGGGTPDWAAIEPPEDETGYPEPGALGKMPAYACYIRHASGIRIVDFDAVDTTPDARPPFALEDVSDIVIDRADADKTGAAAELSLKGVTDLRLRDVSGVRDAHKASVSQGRM